MAQSRLERIGTIFTRVTGLLQANAMKATDKPIWYNIYKKFPPKIETRFDTPLKLLPLRNIFYSEDICRANFHKYLTQPETVNLACCEHDTLTQQFIKIYQKLKAQGPIDDEKIFENALLLFSEKQDHKQKGFNTLEDLAFEEMEDQKKVKSFIRLQCEEDISTKSTSIKRLSTDSDKNNSFDVKNIFKE